MKKVRKTIDKATTVLLVILVIIVVISFTSRGTKLSLNLPQLKELRSAGIQPTPTKEPANNKGEWWEKPPKRSINFTSILIATLAISGLALAGFYSFKWYWEREEVITFRNMEGRIGPQQSEAEIDIAITYNRILKYIINYLRLTIGKPPRAVAGVQVSEPLQIVLAITQRSLAQALINVTPQEASQRLGELSDICMRVLSTTNIEEKYGIAIAGVVVSRINLAPEVQRELDQRAALVHGVTQTRRTIAEIVQGLRREGITEEGSIADTIVIIVLTIGEALKDALAQRR